MKENEACGESGIELYNRKQSSQLGIIKQPRTPSVRPSVSVQYKHLGQTQTAAAEQECNHRVTNTRHLIRSREEYAYAYVCVPAQISICT